MAIKRKTRMYEPWGYREENNYQGAEIIHENDLDSFFADTKYIRDDNKIHFYNKDGEELVTLDVNEFIKSDSIIEKTEYKDGILKIYFTNGDIVTIDLTELLDENEFKDGLIVDGHVVKVLVDAESERWLTVSSNGVKVSGIQAEIDRLDTRIDDEIARATSEEARIEARLDQEIADRIADVDEEETRAIGEETRIDEKLDEEITRSKDADRALDTRIGILNDALTSEKTAREAFDAALSNRLDGETSRATSAETELNTIKANKNEAVARAEYDDATKLINFYDINDVVISSIDVTPFIKDGMIESVKIEDGKLVITFNAESGKEKIEIPLSDIFNPDNYYTKLDIDAKLATINSNMSSETSDRESGDNVLDGKITTLSTIVDAKADTTDVYTKGEIDGKENALQAGIDANADAIALKADKAEIPTDFYTQEEVNVMMSQLLTRIKNLEEKESIVVADTAAEVTAAPANSDVVITSTEAIQALTAGTEYNTITIVGGNANNGDIKAKATDKLTMDGTTINGDKGASNGRVLISASTVDLKNITIESGSTAYNVFEGTQNTADSSFFTSSYTVSNLTVDNTELNHNVLNIYTPADDAVITIKDSYLNLDVDKSNLLRLANYTNATGVTVNFENVEWTYENATASDWGWAGLVIYQPSSTDVALVGDTSKIATWTFNFKNCKYNGEVVDAVNYGEHNQVIYGYDINRTGNVSDISSIVTVNFE